MLRFPSSQQQILLTCLLAVGALCCFSKNFVDIKRKKFAHRWWSMFPLVFMIQVKLTDDSLISLLLENMSHPITRNGWSEWFDCDKLCENIHSFLCEWEKQQKTWQPCVFLKKHQFYVCPWSKHNTVLDANFSYKVKSNQCSVRKHQAKLPIMLCRLLDTWWIFELINFPIDSIWFSPQGNYLHFLGMPFSPP